MRRRHRGRKAFPLSSRYEITKTWANRFAQELAEFDERPEAHPGVHPRLIKLMKDALASQLETLQEELEELEQISGKGEQPG